MLNETIPWNHIIETVSSSENEKFRFRASSVVVHSFSHQLVLD